MVGLLVKWTKDMVNLCTYYEKKPNLNFRYQGGLGRFKFCIHKCQNKQCGLVNSLPFNLEFQAKDILNLCTG